MYVLSNIQYDSVYNLNGGLAQRWGPHKQKGIYSMSEATDPRIHFEPEQNLRDVVNSPKFPYLRLHPAIIDPTRMNELSISEEKLLLAMHLQSRQFLVVSNKSLSIYQIPQIRTGLQTAGLVGAKIGIGFIPGVGELFDAGEKLMGAGEWVKKKWEQREDKSKAKEGMPTKKYIDSTGWDFRNPDTLQLIQIYKEKILLKNGFEWKKVFSMPLENPAEQIAIVATQKEMQIAFGKKKVKAPYLDNSWELLKVAERLIEQNRQALELAGWSVQTANEGYIFKNSK